MADKYHKEIDWDEGSIIVDFDGDALLLATSESDAYKYTQWVNAYCTPAQFRQIATMLIEAADVADGLPARPAAIEDVPLQYVARADSAQDDATDTVLLKGVLPLSDKDILYLNSLGYQVNHNVDRGYKPQSPQGYMLIEGWAKTSQDAWRHCYKHYEKKIAERNAQEGD